MAYNDQTVAINPDGDGNDPVMFGNGNILPFGVRPKNDVNKSSLVKLF